MGCSQQENQVKIIVVSQPHGAHAEIYILLKETVADAYIVCGDLLDGPFYSVDAADSFSYLLEYFHAMKEQGAGISLKEIASNISGSPDSGLDIREKASAFLGLLERARTAMLQKYRILDNVLSTKPYVPVYSLPGCTDMDLRYTALRDRTIHKEARKAGSLVISGLGCPEVGDDALPCSRDLSDAGDEVTKLIARDVPHILALHSGYGNVNAVGDSPEGSGSEHLRLVFFSGGPGTHGVERFGPVVFVRPAAFGSSSDRESKTKTGGFFYECMFTETRLERITLKKLTGERVIDVAEYNITPDGLPGERIIDGERFRELSEGTHLLRDDDIAHVPEIRLFRDIRNFFRIHQTRETELRVERLQAALDSMVDYRDRMALDLVGSANVGLSSKSSDVDMVLYLRAGKGLDDGAFREEFERAESKLRETLGPDFDFEVIDRINLDDVNLGVLERNYDCDTTRLFVTYRSACRAVNYRVLSPLEDRLNQDKTFRQEIQEQMRSYLRMFARTSDNSKSFEKYLLRLKTSGVAIPRHLEKKINMMLQKKPG